ncbi:MAG: DUF1592 domain-containing protein [Myxococcota bacterium]|nr:DUF1592 domain-containing protein [Myxococcota bacterium]
MIRIFALSLLAAACGGSARDNGDGEPQMPLGGRGNAAAGSGGRGTVTGGQGMVSAGSNGAGEGGQGAASSGGLGGGAGAGASNAGQRGVELDGAPLYSRVQRLTNRQWENAVSDVLRFSAPQNLSATFARPVAGAADFDNNERLLFVDATGFLDFESGAEAAAKLATGSPEALAALYDGSDSAELVRSVGRRAFRRPLTPEEEATYQRVFARGEELYGSGFANGAALVIRALLQSPHFLYRTELGPAGKPLSSYEVASKLSFWLLGTTPSDALLDSAEAGVFEDPDRLEAAARQMLEAPGALEVLRDFHDQLLDLGLYQTVDKPGAPEFDPAIDPELERASHAFFERIFREGLGLREVFTSESAFVGPGLAPFYGLDAPAGLELLQLGSARRGYFMQVPFLMLWGVNDASDPAARGAALQKMLCNTRPDPLPLGSALEGFDGLGRQRDTNVGTGRYPFADGSKDFADGTELMAILADSAQAHTCYAKNLAAYGLGRDLVESDRVWLESLAQVSLAESLKETIIALVRAPEFRMRTEAVR